MTASIKTQLWCATSLSEVGGDRNFALLPYDRIVRRMLGLYRCGGVAADGHANGRFGDVGERNNLSGELFLIPGLHAAIEAQPLQADERAALVEIANRVFEKVVDRIEPENKNLTRELWVPVEMKLDGADYLIDAFLWDHVVDLAVEADKRAKQPPRQGPPASLAALTGARGDPPRRHACRCLH
jgi:hypothetical protein